MDRPVLHRAPWLVPVAGPAVADGCVALAGGRIIAAGASADLQRAHPDAPVIDHPDHALTPALVNAHIHLELSHLRLPELMPTVAGFTGWIAALLDQRAGEPSNTAAAEAAARDVLQGQHQQGIIALGDIGNTELGTIIAPGFPGRLLHFHEFLGRSAKTRRTVQSLLDSAPDEKRCTAHAPYSTHPELIQALKARARRLHHPFPIHVAEPPSEAQMLSHGSGELFSFLAERNFVEQPYLPPAVDNPGSVRYLHGLGIIDRQTLCVHCIHVDAGEMEILAASGATVCLCPGSNRYLRVGIAPVERFLASGILPALGTDSVASNPELSLWREMRLLAEDHPTIPPATIFAMATLGGAKALGLASDFGSLAPGRVARLLAVPLPEEASGTDRLFDLLVHGNHGLRPTWISEP